VICRDDRIGVDFGNPKILMDGLVNREVFSPRDSVDGWCYVLGFLPSSQGSCQTLPYIDFDSDTGSRIEEIHIRFITRVVIPNLCLRGVFPIVAMATINSLWTMIQQYLP
jgi:hypothetical protein